MDPKARRRGTLMPHRPPPRDAVKPRHSVVEIDYENCTNCGICIKSCPVDVLRMSPETKWLEATYWEDCMLCKLCELDCPEEGAIWILPDKSLAHVLTWG